MGSWNAWIFVLLGLLIGYMSWVLINTEALKKYRTEPDVPKTRIEKSSERIYFPLALACMVCARRFIVFHDVCYDHF